MSAGVRRGARAPFSSPSHARHRPPSLSLSLSLPENAQLPLHPVVRVGDRVLPVQLHDDARPFGLGRARRGLTQLGPRRQGDQGGRDGDVVLQAGDLRPVVRGGHGQQAFVLVVRHDHRRRARLLRVEGLLNEVAVAPVDEGDDGQPGRAGLQLGRVRLAPLVVVLDDLDLADQGGAVQGDAEL